MGHFPGLGAKINIFGVNLCREITAESVDS